MQKLIQGIHEFQEHGFRPLQGLFEELARGQNPETLFITCSDSRIDPNLLTRAKPGDLFILRNAGNIIPPHGALLSCLAVPLARFDVVLENTSALFIHQPDIELCPGKT